MPKKASKLSARLVMRRATIAIPEPLLDKLDYIRAELGWSRNAAINYAIASSVKRWSSPIDKKSPADSLPLWPSGWPRTESCPYCHLLTHDPIEHYGALGDTDVAEAVARASKSK